MSQLVILTPEEQQVRLDRIRSIMADAGVDAMIISDNANTCLLHI